MELPDTEKKLSVSETLFVAEYIANGNSGPAAYRHAYKSAVKLSVRTLEQRARKLLHKPHIARAVEEGRMALGQKILFDVRDVMQEWMDIATADPNELVSLERRCCRYCHSWGHAYHWTPAEYAEKLAEAERLGTPVPDISGGVDFDCTREPHPNCPECQGEGAVVVVPKDTSKLKGKARKLFAGIKMGRYGPEVLMRDQDAALANIAKSLGMFAEIYRIEHSAAQKLNTPVPDDPVAASQTYQQLLEDSQ